MCLKKGTPSWKVLATGLAEESSGMCENVKLKALLYSNTVSTTFALKLLICEKSLKAANTHKFRLNFFFHNILFSTSNWASEASSTLGCSIKICMIYTVYVCRYVCRGTK